MFEASSARHRLKEALSLLEEERGLLLRGDLAGLFRFEGRRARLIERLPSIPRAALEANEALVTKVRDTARRNARLLEAFIQGVRAAEARIRELTAAKSLGAYRKDGSRIEDVDGGATTSRRL